MKKENNIIPSTKLKCVTVHKLADRNKPYIRVRRNGKKVMLHRLIMEEHLGRKLKSFEVVHHIDNNVRNNNIESLEVMVAGKHTTLHHIGLKYSEETRKKLSESHKGKRLSKETIQKLVAANTGKKRTKKQKENIAVGRARLTKDDVYKIRDMIAKGVNYTEIGKLFGVGKTSICNIKYGRNWEWLN